MAPRQKARAQGSSQAAPGRTAADDAATIIGTSLGELMNRKDALVEQLASVERQIAATRDRIKAAVRRQASPRKASRRSSKPASKAASAAERKGNRKWKRPLPPDDPAAAKAQTRLAQAEVKSRASERLRASMPSGNR